MSDTNYIRHKVNNNKKAVKDFIRKLKKNKKCVMCGESHPSCLEWHHTENKETEICNMYSKYTLEEIKEEIKKCVIVCANCHRKIHWEFKEDESV